MLFLQLPAETAESSVVPAVAVDNATALAFERALLLSDAAARQAEVSAALAMSSNAAGWAMRRAEVRLRRTINRIDEAATWLSANLVRELARSLKADGPSLAGPPANNEISWRLPLLVTALLDVEQRTMEFEQRLEREKLESLKELAYGASHEINNPLANIAARAQTLLEDETDPERQRKLVAIHRQAMRAHEMIADLMLFARPPKLARERFDLNEIVRQVASEWQTAAAENSIHLSCVVATQPIMVFADKTQLGVAIGAVVRNACEAVSDGGDINMSTRCDRNEERVAAEIVVNDDGPGFTGEVRRHMFDPFFSGREAGRGLGFGLSKCWRIVTDHGGEVTAENRNGGTEITIRLPISDEA